MTWSWYVEDQIGIPIVENKTIVIRDVTAQYAMSIAPYTGQTTVEFGKSVAENLLQGSDPSPNGPTWNSTYVPLGSSMAPHSYVGPKGDGTVLYLGAGGTFKHKIHYEEYPEQWKTMSNDSPLVRIKRTANIRTITAVERVWTGDQDPEGDS